MAVKIELISGCMFSGKTTALIRRLEHASAMGRQVFAATPMLNVDLVEPALRTHDSLSMSAVEIRRLSDLARFEVPGAIVGIDEVHFLAEPPKVAATALKELASVGVELVLAGLDLDFRAKPFGITQYLADNIATRTLSLFARCSRCGGKAARSQRLRYGKPASTGEPTLVPGGSELYEPRCESCYERPT